MSQKQNDQHIAQSKKKNKKIKELALVSNGDDSIDDSEMYFSVEDKVFEFVALNEPQKVTKSHCQSYIEFISRSFPNALLENGESIADISNHTFKQIFQLSQLLIELGIQDEALYAAILGYLRLDKVNEKSLVKVFDEKFISIYQRILTMDSLSSLARSQSEVDESNAEQENLRLENLRRMLLTMVDDVRVVLIKLSEQVVVLRHLSLYSKAERDLIANESLEVYAPLANRLGVWQLKWELEDLSFRHQQPQEYRKLSSLISEKRVTREQYIKMFLHVLKQKLKESFIDADVKGRPKHLFSIWKKMQKKNLAFESVFDLRAVRILVDNVSQCYSALGVVHTAFHNVPGEFDDYIAVPKENGYRSIHTAVYGPKGHVVEVQIRTNSMHNENEFGVAAHWRYKEGGGSDKSSKSLENKILWLRQLLDWKSELHSANELIDQFKHEVSEERVYVFSPKGEVIDLPSGSTPIDFAYTIHTEVGHRCRGAKINGRIVQLTTHLKTGDQIEILTVKKGGPSRDWMNQNLGFIKTTKARHCVLRWLKQEDRDVNITSGRHILDKEINKMAASDIKYESIANELDFKHLEDMYVALANGELKITQLANAVKTIQDNLKPKAATQNNILAGTLLKRKSTKANHISGEVSVAGVGNMLISIAKCCAPLPGDNIVGYITQTKGVSIHRQDCSNILKASRDKQHKLLDVAWAKESANNRYDVKISVKAYDRQGVLHDVVSVINNEKINVTQSSTQTSKTTNIANITLTLEVNDYSTLSKVLSKVEQVRNVFEVKRLEQ